MPASVLFSIANVKILIITDQVDAAERQCYIARGFNPWSVIIYFLRPEGVRDVKHKGLTLYAPSGRDYHHLTDLWLKPQAISPDLFEVKNNH